MEETTNNEGAGAGASAEGRFGKAREYVNEKYTAAADGVKSGYNRAKEKYDDVDFGAVADQVRGYVRSNPGKALLISVGAGFLLGLLLRRGDDD
jgi:ElaB/YqjD/DUF883 family membrane-anchored ribosome-binding protein